MDGLALPLSYLCLLSNTAYYIAAETNKVEKMCGCVSHNTLVLGDGLVEGSM